MQPLQAAADKLKPANRMHKGEGGGGGRRRLDVASAQRAKSFGLLWLDVWWEIKDKRRANQAAAGWSEPPPIALGFKGKPRPRPSPRISAVLVF